MREAFEKRWEIYSKKICSGLHPQVSEKIMNILRPSGKRVRPLLFLKALETVGIQFSEDMLDIGVALELFHTAALVHDDLIDGSETRRNRKCLYRSFENRGEHIALVTGDILIAEGYERLSGLNICPVKKSKVLKEVCQAVKVTGYGEISELLNSEERLNSREVILSDYDMKTGYYTFRSPLILACIIADEDNSVSGKVIDFSLYAGRAYQIYNDIEGMYRGDIPDDIKKGIFTYALHLLAGKVGNEHVIELVTGNDDELLIKELTMYGVPGMMKKHADEMFDKALVLLKSTSFAGISEFLSDHVFCD
ncbi:MAG: polyprenyl synthetase family protein [Candidatus Muiribacteriaceae bacterium]